MRRTLLAQCGDSTLVNGIAGALRGQGSFRELEAGPIAQLAHHGTLVELDPGEALIRRDEPDTSEFYVLVEGTLVVQGASGFIARLDQPGTVVGEVAVLMAAERSADVIAQSPVRALALPSGLTSSADGAGVATTLRRIMADSLGAKLRDDWVKYEDFVKF